MSTLSIDLWSTAVTSPSASESSSESPSVSASESPSVSPSLTPSASESASESASPSPAPVEFTELEVLKTERNYHYIEWEVEMDPPETVDDYKFRIYYSLAPECGYEPVLDSEGNIVEIDGAVGPLSWTHDTIKQYDFNKVYYYKIYAILKIEPSRNFWSDEAYIGDYADGHHLVMHQAENILYDMFYGEPVYIVKKKPTGVRCTNCWSSDRQQRILTHCDVCNGSGFIDGYYCAISTQMAFDSEDRKSDSQRNFEDVYDSKRARISNYPMVRPKDLVINRDLNQRYVILHVETTKLPRHATSGIVYSKQNYVVSQLLTLQELNPDDNEYNLNVEDLIL